jgi:hypothetical protein
MRRHSRSLVAAVAAAGAVAVFGGTALTAGNDVTARSFGQGVGVVSGFEVTDVAYATNSDSPDPRITVVQFTIERSNTTTYAQVLPSNATVKVRLNVNGTYSSSVTCDVDLSGDAALCIVSTLNARVGTLQGLSVVAYDTAADV